MLVRTDKDLPADSYYVQDLEALGFRQNDDYQFVNSDTGAFFDFFHSDSVRENEVRKEAMHKAARDCMIRELSNIGIKLAYLSGDTGTNLTNEKEEPQRPHVTILCSDMNKLRTAKNVVIVIGEHSQDLGVFAYRVLMNEGGMIHGSVLGMGKDLGYG
jgi:hypothetical protein